MASFAYGDETGGHTYFILDVQDSLVAEYVVHQTERNIFQESRVPGLHVAFRLGQSVPNAINVAIKQLPK